MLVKFCTALMVLSLSIAVSAADHTVKMKNMGADGTMVFEPGYLKVAVGDTVHFEPTDLNHNSETVAGLLPTGATPWKGAMSKKVSVTIDKEGVYVYQCTPHLMLAMVGVIVAGSPSNLADVKKNSAALSAKFVTNKDRLDKYLAQVK